MLLAAHGSEWEIRQKKSPLMNHDLDIEHIRVCLTICHQRHFYYGLCTDDVGDLIGHVKRLLLNCPDLRDVKADIPPLKRQFVPGVSRHACAALIVRHCGMQRIFAKSEQVKRSI